MSTVRPEEVLVVLPALNESAHLETCIRTLYGSDDWLSRATVVVADGGSTDGTREITMRLCDARPNLALIENPGRLQSAGLNLAVQDAATAQHRILVRCDVHSVYPEGFVRDVAEALVARAAASLVVPLDSKGTGCFQRASAWVVDTPLGSGGSAHRGGTKSAWVDHGHHAGFDLDWFRRIGGYDAEFSHNEDAEYDIRLGQAGGRVWLESGIRVGYFMRPTLRSLTRQYWTYGQGRARTVLKHRLRPRLRQMIPVINLALLVISLLILPATMLGLLWPALYLSVLAAVSLWGVTAIGVCGLFAGLSLASMHLAWAAGFIKGIASGVGSAPHRAQDVAGNV